MGEKKYSTVRQLAASSAAATFAVMATAVMVAEPAGIASAAPDCKDVFVLAVPGTWETNAKANPNRVPGMLSKVTQPLERAVSSGATIDGPATPPVQIGQEKPSEGAQAIGSYVGGLLDTAATKIPSTSGTDLSAGTETGLPTQVPGFGSSSDVPSTSVPSTESTTPDSTTAPAEWSPDSGGPSVRPVDSSTSQEPGPSLWSDSSSDSSEAGESSSPSSESSIADVPDGGEIGKSVGFEQVPYVAQVGGPIAGFVKHNPLTLGESRANGVKALNKRLSEIGADCPSSDVEMVGYSQGALVAGDVLSAIGNGRGPIPASRVLGAGLLSDPARTPTTADLDTETAAPVAQALPGSETLVGPNVPGQGAVGARPDGFGELADRVTSFCAQGDAICSLTGKSPAIAAVVPLLNLKKEDIGPYATSRVMKLLTNVASTPPEDLTKAITSVTTAATQLTAAGATGVDHPNSADPMRSTAAVRANAARMLADTPLGQYLAETETHTSKAV